MEQVAGFGVQIDLLEHDPRVAVRDAPKAPLDGHAGTWDRCGGGVNGSVAGGSDEVLGGAPEWEARDAAWGAPACVPASPPPACHPP